MLVESGQRVLHSEQRPQALVEQEPRAAQDIAIAMRVEEIRRRLNALGQVAARHLIEERVEAVRRLRGRPRRR